MVCMLDECADGAIHLSDFRARYQHNPGMRYVRGKDETVITY